jgi:hypothetical protein
LAHGTREREEGASSTQTSKQLTSVILPKGCSDSWPIDTCNCLERRSTASGC